MLTSCGVSTSRIVRVAAVCITVRRLLEGGFRVEEGCNASDVDSLA